MTAMKCARAAWHINMPSCRSRRSACVSIALPVDYRQRRADTAGVIAEGADDFNAPLDDAPSLLANSKSDDPDRGEEGASPPASPL